MKQNQRRIVLLLTVCAGVLTAFAAWASATCQDNLSCNDANYGLGIVSNTYSASTANGLQGFSNYSVGVSVSATNDNAAWGQTVQSGASGIYAEGRACYAYGAAGRGTTTNAFCDATGVLGTGTSTYAGEFTRGVYVAGDLNVTGNKNFRIDHPLHPSTKYLVHSAVESLEPKDIYRGSVVLDTSGRARVTLPSYFQALHKDYRYQLTSIGAPSTPYVLEEIKENSFVVAGSRPGAKVSWQVTGVRNDSYSQAHPFVVERKKQSEPRKLEMLRKEAQQ